MRFAAGTSTWSRQFLYCFEECPWVPDGVVAVLRSWRFGAQGARSARLLDLTVGDVSDVAAWKVPEPWLHDRPFRLEEIPGTGQRAQRAGAEFEAEAAASVLWPRRTFCRDLDGSEAKSINLSQGKALNREAAGRAMWCCSNAPSWQFAVMRRARSLQYLAPLCFCSFPPFAALVVQASLVPTSRSDVTSLRR